MHIQMNRMKKSLTILTTALGLSMSACVSTNYTAYSGSGVFVGQGGANRNVNGVDLWVYGAPNRPYQVIGYIEDSRPGGAISMAGREKGVAAEAKARGADGVIINSDSRQYMGSVSNGTVNGWVAGSSFSMNGFGTTVPVMRRESTFLAIKYVNKG
jgi:hypothetical protein